ncbi:MAG: type II toxin-antitoxin system RelE/ParE family toxin [Spirochaetia bacterium]|jgi:plasmid stabilization system protein ParE|nr:type II toxin-antitoxin system RelE/ParE family toxin [Spirochaetia bacterium]
MTKHTNIIFSEFAKLELEDAEAYYEFHQEGLGKRFKLAIKKGIERIIQFPLSWPFEKGEVRKCILSRFPYKILYSKEEDHIFIIAIAHTHREPNYWADQ